MIRLFGLEWLVFVSLCSVAWLLPAWAAIPISLGAMARLGVRAYRMLVEYLP